MPGTIRDGDPRYGQEPLAVRLGAFAAGLSWGELDDEVRAEARRVFVNTLSVAVAGAADDGIRQIGGALLDMGEAGSVAVPGWPAGFNLPAAALVTAAAANVLDYDDTHIPTLIHLGAPIYGALVALAQQERVSGPQFLTAFVAGAEIACRLGLALTPAHYDDGFHVTATCGVVGAAVACGKVLGLDAGGMANAIGIAAHASSGLIENLSSGAKSVGVGDAARNGLMAAFYARAGIDAATTSVEGKNGFLRVLSRAPRAEGLDDGLGAVWQFLESSSKPYASCVLTFPVIDAVLELKERHGVNVDAIRAVEIHGNPLLLARADRVHPTTAREAKLSLHHSVAVSLINGTAGVKDFLQDAIENEDVRSLAGKVKAIGSHDFSTVAAKAKIMLDGDESVELTVSHGRGSRERPLTEDEVRRKALTIFSDAWPGVDGNARLRSVWEIADSADVAASLLPFLTK
ncbi:MmgE/PrpD family protein [Mesorhizobium sp. CAU 1732]|uniref:MmgE/PrpD family protein n=1 Tax=Mesorhizobium sp. CAU 1732 TaxID=3140358 RepID=UPI003260B0EC